MKKVILSVLVLLATSCCALAAGETVDELIAQLEGKNPEVIVQETRERQDIEWAKRGVFMRELDELTAQ